MVDPIERTRFSLILVKPQGKRSFLNLHIHIYNVYVCSKTIFSPVSETVARVKRVTVPVLN